MTGDLSRLGEDRALAVDEPGTTSPAAGTDDTEPNGGEGTGGAPGADAHPARRLYWWLEIAFIIGFYIIYSAVRNQFGSAGAASVSTERAFDNAVRIIDIEQALGLYHEETIQGWFTDQIWFMQTWNVFYGTFHFAVTAGVLLWLFYKFPARYPRARNTLAATTSLALVGFSTFPLMPPRLLAVGGEYGGARFGGTRYDYIDSLAEFGGTWSFDSGAMQAVSNQFAAMPSLHFGWSSWCLLLLWPVLRNRWSKALIAFYPLGTLFAIVVTANHYWLDAVGGAVVLGAGVMVGTAITNFVTRLRNETIARRRATSSG